MSAAVAEKTDIAAKVKATRKVSGKGWTRYHLEFEPRGKTQYRVWFDWNASPEARVAQFDGEHALPKVTVVKSTEDRHGRHSETALDLYTDAPRYVQDGIKAVFDADIAEHEHNFHRVPPIPQSTMEKWHGHGEWWWTGAEVRKAELVFARVARPGVRTTEAREIAAWIVRDMMPKADHDEMVEELKRENQRLRDELAEDKEAAIEEAKEEARKAGDKVAEEVGSFLAEIQEPGWEQYAYGNTLGEKLEDAARHAVNEIELYWNAR